MIGASTSSPKAPRSRKARPYFGREGAHDGEAMRTVPGLHGFFLRQEVSGDGTQAQDGEAHKDDGQ